MAPKRRTSVQRYHDRVAGRYDHSYEDSYWRWHDAMTWDHIKPHLPKNHRSAVVDLGCGTGKWAAKLNKSGYDITCVDISRAMLDRARAKLFSERGKVEFVQADLVDLGALPRSHFALAVAMGDPIGCTSAPPKALKEIRKIMTSGGILVATFDNRLNALDFYLEKGDVDTMAEFLRTGRTHWLTRQREERFDVHAYTPGQVQKLLSTAGFEIIDMIGKTVLPMRRFRHLLEDVEANRAWMKIEKSMHRDPAAIGRASHIQVAAKVQP